MWFIGVEVEQETSAPPPKNNPGSAPDDGSEKCRHIKSEFVVFVHPFFRLYSSTLFVCEAVAKFSGVEFLRTIPKSRKRKKREISTVTRKNFFFFDRLLLFLTFSLPSPSWLRGF